MLPLRDRETDTGHADPMAEIPAELDPERLAGALPVDWRFELLADRVGSARGLEPGTVLELDGRETVTAAPELARLSLNLAKTHTDAGSGARGRRLVYGGQTIAIAAAHVTRALPSLATIVAWRSCEHSAPVFEGDILSTVVTIVTKSQLGSGAGIGRSWPSCAPSSTPTGKGGRRPSRCSTGPSSRSSPRSERREFEMPGILEGMRVIEGSAFVAAPLGGMTLAQLGADVIRFDNIGGGLDRNRWPVNEDGKSLFWAGMNKGKRSIQVDMRSGEGRELLTALATAPGPDAGMVLTNFPIRGWLDFDALRNGARI